MNSKPLIQSRPDTASGTATLRGTFCRVDPAHSSRVPDTSGAPLLQTRHLVKNYRRGRHVVSVLRGIDLQIAEGEFLAIVGQSGSGKSTLLHLLGTLDAPDEGEILFEGHRIDRLPQAGRDLLRNKYFGMVFQFYHLLPELSTRENILTPLMIRDGLARYLWNRRHYRKWADQLLEMVGLSHRAAHRPRELSGGEMQRAAIARSLANQPRVLLADEPTGNLDRSTGDGILQLLRTLNQHHQLTIVMVTHDPAVAAQANRVVRLVEGRVEPA
jgi:lipoprotein-releasing system ATP-binding protein